MHAKKKIITINNKQNKEVLVKEATLHRSLGDGKDYSYLKLVDNTTSKIKNPPLNYAYAQRTLPENSEF